MNYIIFDLEATCWGENTPIPAAPEIIEIGAVKLDLNGQERSYLELFVKPTELPVLSDFCRSLTTIKQRQIDNAPNLPEALEIFKEWIGDDEFISASWGEWDKEQLLNESKKYNLNINWLNNHINLKDQYRDIKMLRRKVGLNTALRKEGFLFDGTHHRGVDDAKNLTKIFQLYFPVWDFSKLI